MRPSATASRNVFTYSGETSGFDVSDAPNILNRSYTITAEVEVPQGGGDGMLATLGGRFGGYGLYLLKGKPVFTYNFVDLERSARKVSRRPHTASTPSYSTLPPMALQDATAEPYRELLQRIANRPNDAWTVDDMAAAAGQAPRSFHRKWPMPE
jgi:hypothetical protein